jgi:hypothetical protein
MHTERTPVSARIVEAVARSNGVDPTDLSSLYETIDPDALDALVSSHSDGTGQENLSVQFTYAGREVVVRSSEDIDVRVPAAERDDSLAE